MTFLPDSTGNNTVNGQKQVSHEANLMAFVGQLLDSTLSDRTSSGAGADSIASGSSSDTTKSSQSVAHIANIIASLIERVLEESALESPSGSAQPSNEGYGYDYGATASGDDAVAIGNGATASGTQAIAFGNSAWANGTDARAIGNGASASGTLATAWGTDASAQGNRATAVGSHAQARGKHTLADGIGAKATGTDSEAIGAHATASDGGIAVGTNAKAGKGQVDITASNQNVVVHDPTDKITDTGSNNTINVYGAAKNSSTTNAKGDSIIYHTAEGPSSSPTTS